MEYVGFDPLTFIAILWAVWSGGVVRFASGHSRALAFWRHRLPAERFDEFESLFAIDAESHWQIFRAVEGRAEEIRSSSLFRALLSFFPDPKLDVIVRKGVIAESFMELVLRRDTDLLQAEGRPVFLLLRERRPFLERLYPSAQASIPWGWRGASKVKEWISMGLLPVYFGVGGLWKFIRNGMAVHLPPPRRWTISSIMRPSLTPPG